MRTIRGGIIRVLASEEEQILNARALCRAVAAVFKEVTFAPVKGTEDVAAGGEEIQNAASAVAANAEACAASIQRVVDSLATYQQLTARISSKETAKPKAKKDDADRSVLPPPSTSEEATQPTAAQPTAAQPTAAQPAVADVEPPKEATTQSKGDLAPEIVFGIATIKPDGTVGEPSIFDAAVNLLND